MGGTQGYLSVLSVSTGDPGITPRAEQSVWAQNRNVGWLFGSCWVCRWEAERGSSSKQRE